MKGFGKAFLLIVFGLVWGLVKILRMVFRVIAPARVRRRRLVRKFMDEDDENEDDETDDDDGESEDSDDSEQQVDRHGQMMRAARPSRG